jgi:methylated-DNA-[protein]-cysteine S-methyltransferase
MKGSPTAPCHKTEFLAMESPIGWLGLSLCDGALYSLDFLSSQPDGAQIAPENHPLIQALRGYFANPIQRFDVPLMLAGTPYQRRVWQALCQIPSGKTRTYGDLAAELGSGARAIGMACRTNPCPILVPCHRILAKTGLGGYSGATTGVWPDIKRWLLRHEGLTLD